MVAFRCAQITRAFDRRAGPEARDRSILLLGLLNLRALGVDFDQSDEPEYVWTQRPRPRSNP